MPGKEYGPPLLAYARMVWRRRILVLVIAAAMTVPAAVLSSLQAPVYRATAELVLGQQRLDNDFNIEAVDLTDRQIATQVRVIRGNEVTDRAVALGARGAVEVSTPSLSNVLTVSAQDTDPERAARTANAYVEGYIDYRTAEVRRTLDEAAEQLQQRITLLQQELVPLIEQVNQTPVAEREAVQATIQPLQSALQEQRASLHAQLGQLQVQRALAASGARMVQRAEPPGAPISPRPARDSALAATLGIALGVSLAVLLETMGAPPGSATKPESRHSPAGSPKVRAGSSTRWPFPRRRRRASAAVPTAERGAKSDGPPADGPDGAAVAEHSAVAAESSRHDPRSMNAS